MLLFKVIIFNVTTITNTNITKIKLFIIVISATIMTTVTIIKMIVVFNNNRKINIRKTD